MDKSPLIRLEGEGLLPVQLRGRTQRLYPAEAYLNCYNYNAASVRTCTQTGLSFPTNCNGTSSHRYRSTDHVPLSIPNLVPLPIPNPVLQTATPPPPPPNLVKYDLHWP